MKFREISSHKLIIKYKFTPLFWKILATIVFVFCTGIFLYSDMPFSSVSIVSASDSPDAASVSVSKTLDEYDPAYSADISATSTPGISSPTDGAVSNSPDQNSGTNSTGKNGSATDPPVVSAKPDDAYIPSASDNLFANSAFIGDSRTEGLFMYSGIKGAQIYAVKGLNLKSVFSNAFITGSSGKKVTVLDDMQGKSFTKIYISFGLNELGWSGDTYINKYKDLIMHIKDIQPNAIIYVQSTFPINPDKCKFTDETNRHILSMNSQLKSLADSTSGVRYVDIVSEFKDQRGNLKLEASSDGIHLNRKYCIQWLKCLEDNLKGSSAAATNDAKAQSNVGITSDSVPQVDNPALDNSGEDILLTD